MKADLKDVAVELTILTGEMWTLSTDGETLESESAYIRGYLRTWPKDRLVFTPGTPEGVRSHLNTNEITCNPSRSPRDIARDIRNRILDEARDFHVENMEKEREEQERLSKEKALHETLKKHGFDSYQSNQWYIKGLTIAVYTNSIRIERTSDITLDQLLKIKEILGE